MLDRPEGRQGAHVPSPILPSVEKRSICRQAAAQGGGWNTVVEICNALKRAPPRGKQRRPGGLLDWMGPPPHFQHTRPNPQALLEAEGEGQARKREGVAPPGGAGS
jgi:hypothetical protein